MFAVVQPHRVLVTSVVAASSLIVVAVTSILGIACRHGAINVDKLLSICSALSFAMLFGKLYVATTPFLENYLLQESSRVHVDFTSNVSRGRAHKRTDRNAVAVVSSMTPLKQPTLRKQKRRTVSKEQQTNALRQLIDAICVQRGAHKISDIFLRVN
jgi:hypothetical protein